MHTKTVIVGSAIGLHARPAAIISEAVVNAGVPVTLSVDGGEPVDAGSALMIMTLGAGQRCTGDRRLRGRGGVRDASPSWCSRTSTPDAGALLASAHGPGADRQ